MLQTKTYIHSWGVGLSSEQAALIQDVLGDEHLLSLYALETLPPLPENDVDRPCLVWIAPGCASALQAAYGNWEQCFESIPKALLLEEGYSLTDLEAAFDFGLMEVIRSPLSKERIADAMRRALELRSIHHDVHCMTREILLERELLERKNNILSFLVDFLCNTTEHLDLQQILQNAYNGINKLLPLHGIHAVFWERENNADPTLSLYTCSPENSPAGLAWQEKLTAYARILHRQDYSIHGIHRLCLCDKQETELHIMPDEGTVLCLPIIDGVEQLGALLLHSSTNRRLGRDQATALDSAMRHFALSTKNARRFCLAQRYADYDTLTQVHSRRHFENRLNEEVQCCMRYGQGTSLILLDIDHFKNVNDSNGHDVGDAVLRELAGILAENIRNTDYCARYGGEEFAILLPHTGEKKAMILAERMCKKIAARTFSAQGNCPLKLTVSMGISCLTPGSGKDKQTLLREADAALYAAKRNGRNQVCESSLVLEEQHAHAG